MVDGEVKASVIVCTHNRVDYLRECLASIAAQKCSEQFEVVVVDNGSTDGTSEALSGWCARDPRFYTIREDRLGLSRAKNAGIAAARGAFLLFTDDDVIVESHWIQTYVDFFSNKPHGPFAAGGVIIPVPSDLGAWPAWFDENALCNVGLLDYKEQRRLESWEYLWGANMALPRSVFLQFGGWEESVGRRGEERGTFEDVEIQDRIRSGGGSSWFCPGAIVKHRIDRRMITPRRVVSKAFARGRNECLQKTVLAGQAASGRRRQGVSICAMGLLMWFLLWISWTVAFRVFKNGRNFERSRYAASSCGWWMCQLQSLVGSGSLSLEVGRLIFATRGVVLCLTPEYLPEH